MRRFFLSFGTAFALVALIGAGVSFAPQAWARIDSFKLSASDDYHELARLDRGTWRITEKGSEPANVSYVIVGEERALLVDSGSGKNITGMVTAATRLPITVVPTHLHAEHLGSAHRYERLALPDLPELRERADSDGALTPSMRESWSVWPPKLKVTDWIAPGSEIDLGGRSVILVHTPGHTPESISIVDEDSGRLFSGDLLIPGDVEFYGPGADTSAALASVQKLRATYPELKTVWGAHGEGELPASALGALEQVLQTIEDGTASGALYWKLAGLVRSYISIGVHRNSGVVVIAP
ncbi:MAG: hydroxyacylglutathione hydrolase [Hyphomicrobiaceae bacterium]